MFFKLPDEVCVISQNQSLKIRQLDKICCCLLLTSAYLKKMHLDVVDFTKEGKGKPECRGEIL